MKKRKMISIKSASIAVAVIVFVTVCVAICVAVSLVAYHLLFLDGINGTREYYEDYSVQKGDYVLSTTVCDDKYVTFTVSNVKGQCVFTCEEKWRLFDFKSLDFAEDSYDIIVVSRDTGITKYIYDSGKWFQD